MKLLKLKHGQTVIVIFLILLSAIPLYIAMVYPPYVSDDSLITLTFAKNLAAGKGFIYNQPPPVLGTTTPLFTFIVGGLGFIFGVDHLVAISVFFTALCCLCTPWIFYFFRKVWQISSWQVLILSLVVNGSIWIGFLGMEAYLFSFLLVLSYSLFLNHNLGWCGFVVALLFLTRGEGVLVAGVVGGGLVLENLSLPEKTFDVSLFFKDFMKMMAGLLAPLIVWAVYALSTFGSIFPNTLRAKQAQGQNQFGIPFLYRLFTQWIPNWGSAFDFGKQHSIINFWWFFVVIGLVYVILKNRRWLLFLAWIMLYISGYSVLKVSAYWWYQLPIIFVMDLLFGLGLVFVIQWMMNHFPYRKIAFGASVLLIASVGIALGYSTFMSVDSFEGDFRGPFYIELSEWFNKNSNPSDSIGFLEIGYIGYYTDNQIVDLAGLVTPDIVPYVSEGNFVWGLWAHEPDYYIHHSAFDWALGDILQDSRFENHYALVHQLPGFMGCEFMIYKHQ